MRICLNGPKFDHSKDRVHSKGTFEDPNTYLRQGLQFVSLSVPSILNKNRIQPTLEWGLWMYTYRLNGNYIIQIYPSHPIPSYAIREYKPSPAQLLTLWSYLQQIIIQSNLSLIYTRSDLPPNGYSIKSYCILCYLRIVKLTTLIQPYGWHNPIQSNPFPCQLSVQSDSNHQSNTKIEDQGYRTK